MHLSKTQRWQHHNMGIVNLNKNFKNPPINGAGGGALQFSNFDSQKELYFQSTLQPLSTL